MPKYKIERIRDGEAIQWTGENKEEVLAFLGSSGGYSSGGFPEGMWVYALSTTRDFIGIGCWIFRGRSGYLSTYPKDSIFTILD